MSNDGSEEVGMYQMNHTSLKVAGIDSGPHNLQNGCLTSLT